MVERRVVRWVGLEERVGGQRRSVRSCGVAIFLFFFNFFLAGGGGSPTGQVTEI